MDRQYLIDFTKDTDHHGLNSPEILINFMEYQRICCDPLNVFRFMEEKVICTFMPEFWIEKSIVEAKMGDYQSCFESLDMASQYVEDGPQKQSILFQIQEHQKLFQNEMVINMRKQSLNSKRTTKQSSSNLLSDSFTLPQNRKKEMVDLYKKQYGALQEEILKKEETEMKRKYPESWLFAIYQQEDSRENQIIYELLESSTKHSRMHQSMFTPRKRSLARLSKALDSVEMAKKKIPTREKQRNQSRESQEEPDEEDSNNMKVLSLPVGKKFSQIKKNRVTFKKQGSTEKIRGKEHQQSSGKGILRSIIKRRKHEKMDIEDPDN